MRANLSERLEGEGLVTRLGNGSVVIRIFSRDEVLQNLRVRRLLENEAAALAAGRLDAALHALIAQGCGVPLLAALIRDLRAKARMCNLARMPLQFVAQGHEHVRLIEALSRGDAVVARQAMDVHSEKVRIAAGRPGRPRAALRRPASFPIAEADACA
ncbi:MULTISPECIES: FCD domain-containing protein [Roseomonadaceae]|uniref:FCD domain-containing protein n=1 Tax=Falsiroseomonas oleicola TaxID=2801474 RepID=A0ABS6H255_9PROT|nr:FCD domain-containing protein [Roseomonas oleicola]MBU8542504.1 FCD domain-containing protein [Roseomonas oleicola]